MNPSILHNILVIRLSSLGDVLLTTPLLRTLKQKYNGANIDYLVKDQYADVLKDNPNIRNILRYNPSSELATRLEQNNYDLVIDMQNNPRSKKITSILKKPVYKFNKRSAEKFLLVNFRINRLKNSEPIPVRYISAVPGLAEDEQGLDLFLAGNVSNNPKTNTKVIGVAPGSRHLTKMWPLEYYIELVKLLMKDGCKIIVFGGKSDRAICAQIASISDNITDASNDDNLEQTAQNMKQCSMVVCNDSGLMHTAAALRIPVAVFFGSTVREFGFTPYKTKNLILENKLLNCRPCSHIGRESCPLGHFRCMLEITPQIALERILTLLNS